MNKYLRLLKKNKKTIGSTNIICIGDIILDHYVYGNINRMSPEAPIPILNINKNKYLLGGAANVANNLTSLGAKVILISLFSKDEISKKISDLIVKNRNIKNFPVIDTKYKTPEKTRYINNSSQLLRTDNEIENYRTNKKNEDKLFNIFKKNINKCNIVIISDYCKGTLPETLLKKIIKVSKNNNKKIIVDTKKINFSTFRGVDLITPNTDEFIKAAGINKFNEKKLIQTAQEMCKNLDLKGILITRSSDGMLLVNKSYRKKINSIAKDVYDVTGAGDTVLAAVALLKAIGIDTLLALDFANYAASKVIEKQGTAVISIKDFL